VALTRLTRDLHVYHGVANVGILRHGSRALLIDCGDDGVRGALAELGIDGVDLALATHHHRDSTSGLAGLAEAGTSIGVPADERAWFEDVEVYWNDPAHRWHLYDFYPHPLMLARSVPVRRALRGGDCLSWGNATITVLDTPGHTEGSVSYLVDVDGRRIAFCGDVLCGEGQIWELYSLQKGWATRDYHGFLGERSRLVDSLERLRASGAEVFVPTHGSVIEEPGRAIDALESRLEACYRQYAAISALRHYFPGLFARYREGKGRERRWPAWMMRVGEGRPYPAWLHHVDTTWIVRSQDGPAFALPQGIAPGRWVIPVDVIYGGRRLGQFREAVLECKIAF